MSLIAWLSSSRSGQARTQHRGLPEQQDNPEIRHHSATIVDNQSDDELESRGPTGIVQSQSGPQQEITLGVPRSSRDDGSAVPSVRMPPPLVAQQQQLPQRNPQQPHTTACRSCVTLRNELSERNRSDRNWRDKAFDWRDKANDLRDEARDWRHRAQDMDRALAE